jgi:hypothetical protein
VSDEEIEQLLSRINQALAGIEEYQQPDQDVIEDILTEDTQTRRAMMQYRLNQLYKAIYPLTQQKNNPQQLEAIDRLLDVMDIECRLWGLYQQPQAYSPPYEIVREAQAPEPDIVA